MRDDSALRISCPSCGLARDYPMVAGPAPLPHHCPRCGTDLVAEGLLIEETSVARQAAAPRARLRSLLGETFAPPAAWEAAALALFALLLFWSFETRGFLAAAIAGADLVFHEAGHPLFGLLGSRFLMFLGGTIAQLAFPVAAAVGFARVRRAAPFAVALLWIGFNLVDVGRYAADASARVLPLLAPDVDSHDWWNLLGMLGLRERCRGIGGAISLLGWLLWAGAPLWLGRSWWQGRRGSRPS